MVSQETAEHLFPFGIYTIVHSGRLEDAAGAPRRRLAFTEHHAWVTGARFLQEAGRREQKVAVVFAAAEEIRGVTHWGFLRASLSHAQRTEEQRVT